MGRDGTEWHGMAWDGMGCDAMGRGETGWDGAGNLRRGGMGRAEIGWAGGGEVRYRMRRDETGRDEGTGYI